MNRRDLEQLSKEELIELALQSQRREKTSRNSSKPPSTDRKERRENAKPGAAKPGREGHARGLGESPDAGGGSCADHCLRCGPPFGEDAERTSRKTWPFPRRHDPLRALARRIRGWFASRDRLIWTTATASSRRSAIRWFGSPS
jgi:hypothetical protein